MNNKNIFSTKEYNNWIDRDGLLREEEEIITNYLDKRKSTLEAGTASGRILFEMNKLGFTNLTGFDYIPEYIDAAKKKYTKPIINFLVQDATTLKFEDKTFEQIIYLQQIISTIEDPEMRLQALKESYRILRNNGTAIFSFLNFESKLNDKLFKIIFPLIKFFRCIKRNKHDFQYIPWFKYSDKVNFKALLDIGPYNYWYRIEEIIIQLKSVGYEIIFYGYPENIIHKKTFNFESVKNIKSNKGHLYVVCKKS